MAKQRRHRKGGRVTPKGTRPLGQGPGRRQGPGDAGTGWGLAGSVESGATRREQDAAAVLRRTIDLAYRSGDPVDLLMLASSMLTIAGPRSLDPLARRDTQPDVRLADMVEPFLEDGSPGVSGLLAVLATLVEDEVVAPRIRGELLRRQPKLPAWLATLDATVVRRVVEQRDVLGDGDNLLLELGIGAEILTLTVYVDHNMGGVVKDAFLLPVDIARMQSLIETEPDAEDLTWTSPDRAVVRARIVDAIEHGARVYPPLESDSWPASRPLVEWAVGLLPDRGVLPSRPQWPEADRSALAERFLISPEGTPFDTEDHDGLLQDLIWFGTDYGPGDPLRWSPVNVEIVLVDWVPRKIVAPATSLTKLPDLLRAFIRFAHRERGIRVQRTEETLAAVDRWEAEYQSLIRSERPQGAEAIARAVLGAPSSADDSDGRFETFMEDYEATLSAIAGGAEALAALDDMPLPDEPFDWTEISDDVHDHVAEVLAFCDRVADELFDVEFRTAARRLLALLAAKGPASFRGNGKPGSAAAAVCWLVARANRLLSPETGGAYAKDILAVIGRTGTASGRAEGLLRNAGLAEKAVDYNAPAPMLTARTRARLVEARDNVGDFADIMGDWFREGGGR